MTRDDTLLRASTALDRGQADVAAGICASWLTTHARDAQVRHLHGRCLAALGRLDLAAGEYRRAIQINPRGVAALADLGGALLALGETREAADALSAALRLDDRPAELHCALGQCRLAMGELMPAAAAFQAALARNPRYAEAYNNLGATVDRLGNLAGALRCFEQAVALNPESALMQRNFADVLRRSGRLPDAISALRRAMSLAPEKADWRCEFAELLLDCGSAAEAEAEARIAVAQDPGSARAHAALGMALLAMRLPAPAAGALERARALDPSLAYVLVNLGEALRLLDRMLEASAAYRAALRIDAGLSEAHLGLGRTLATLGETDAAAQSLESAYAANPGDAALGSTVGTLLEELGYPERALSILSDASSRHPGSADLAHALGALWHRRGRLGDAIAAYDRALFAEPGRRRALLDRGHALESHGEIDRAIVAFETALKVEDCAEAIAGLASCAFRLCDWTRVEGALRRLEALPYGLDALHPFLLIAAGIESHELREVFERRAGKFAVSAWLLPRRPSRAPLRVAYVSPDFREHPVGHAIVEIIERHSRDRLSVVGVSLAAADGSTVGTRLRSAFDVLIDASGMTDKAVIARLRELDIDIAVDLAGFTTGARTGIFAGRCAPVQINFLGFPSTMGAPFMDYLLADEIVIPRGEEGAYTERVLRLPTNYLPMDATRVLAVVPDRATAGLPTSGFVFCAFNSPHKIARGVFEVWMSLLREVEGSVLWLRGAPRGTAENLRGAATDLGIAAERLVFAPHVERMDAHLARLSLADLFLDTLPYNAHTTAADALLAGVPVLSCRGETFAGRVGASLLKAVGLEELTASDLEDYGRKALYYAREPAELRRVRERLEAARSRSPLFDTAAYTRNLEEVYFEMVAYATEKPADQAV